jgi:hypothetical protein
MIIAGIFYIIGFAFAFYFCWIILVGRTIFNISGLVICTAYVCGPILIATVLLISSVKRIDLKYKIMKIYMLIVFAFYFGVPSMGDSLVVKVHYGG